MTWLARIGLAMAWALRLAEVVALSALALWIVALASSLVGG